MYYSCIYFNYSCNYQYREDNIKEVIVTIESLVSIFVKKYCDIPVYRNIFLSTLDRWANLIVVKYMLYSIAMA